MRKCEINENINFTFEDPREPFYAPGFMSTTRWIKYESLYHRSSIRKNKMIIANLYKNLSIINKNITDNEVHQ